jgi:signal transduction histidine kinase
MSASLSSVFIVIFSTVVHLTAYLQLRLNPIDFQIFPPQWERQIIFLLALSLFFVILMPLYQNRSGLIRLMILVRAGILVLIGWPLGTILEIEMTLLSALVVEIFYYCDLLESIVHSLFLVVAVAALQQPVKAWGMILPGGSVPDVVSFLIFMLMIIALSAFARYQFDIRINSTDVEQQRDESNRKLAEANLRLQEYAAISEEGAKVGERKRMAREIHDTLGYTLTNLVMMLEAAIDMSVHGKGELTEHLKRARDQAKEGLTGVRDAIRALRPMQIEEESGLTAIHRLISTFIAATRIQVNLNLGDAPANFGVEADWTAYRLVQEGITNALRHGKATLIEVAFNREYGGVRIRIKDNGKCLTQNPQEGYGLMGMRERVERLDGDFSFAYESGRGFTVSAWLPLKED